MPNTKLGKGASDVVPLPCRVTLREPTNRGVWSEVLPLPCMAVSGNQNDPFHFFPATRSVLGLLNSWPRVTTTPMLESHFSHPLCPPDHVLLLLLLLLLSHSIQNCQWRRCCHCGSVVHLFHGPTVALGPLGPCPKYHLPYFPASADRSEGILY